MSYTKEQLKYINYNKNNHTKLLACAGSGKTRCIIARINYLIEKNIYGNEEILMLTFSRFTRDDFMNKIKKYGGSISNSFVKTIDSFAKQIIDHENTADVSLLSFRLMKFLECETIDKLKKNPNINRIKTVFIDEAQDLNEIQYRIFCLMKDKLNIVVNMVGDPNQNIYQFRNSSDKYLTEFNGVVFKLTRNFRSYLPVVNFSKYLRPFADHDVVCNQGSNNCEPVMMFYENEKILEENIIELLKSAQTNGIDLSEFAILSPTRGRMRGGGRSHGLCFVSNILYKAGIKFKQFYEESVDDISGEGIKYYPIKKHVNLLTYMGSKGLEWNYVIIIDADMCLINKKYFNEEKHKHDRYLLYVACSRAIQNMYIFSRCYYKGGSPYFNTNPWFGNIPINFYRIDERFAREFFFPEIRCIDLKNEDRRLSKIIDQLDCYDLEEISNIINNKCTVFDNKIFKNDYTSEEKKSAQFLAKYAEHLFRSLYNIKMNRKQMTFPEIENIIEMDTVVLDMPYDVIQWYYDHRKTMTWKNFDNDKNIPKNIRNMINKSFNRNKRFNAHIVACDGYYQWFILDQKKWIKNLYTKYHNCRNLSHIRKILFYLMIIVHGIETQHYFHIKSKGIKYAHILNDFREMFDDIEKYVNNIDHRFVIKSSDAVINRWNMTCKIDMIDDNGIIWSLRCSSDITLKHLIYSIVTTLMHRIDLIDDNFRSSDGTDRRITFNTNFVNFVKGNEIGYKFKFDTKDVGRIIDIFHKKINADK